MNSSAISSAPAAAADAALMDRALDLARRGVALASPNPMVGAVLVQGSGPGLHMQPAGKIVGEGFHSYDGLCHAEIIALEAAREAAASPSQS